MMAVTLRREAEHESRKESFRCKLLMPSELERSRAVNVRLATAVKPKFHECHHACL